MRAADRIHNLSAIKSRHAATGANSFFIFCSQIDSLSSCGESQRPMMTEASAMVSAWQKPACSRRCHGMTG